MERNGLKRAGSKGSNQDASSCETKRVFSAHHLDSTLSGLRFGFSIELCMKIYKIGFNQASKSGPRLRKTNTFQELLAVRSFRQSSQPRPPQGFVSTKKTVDIAVDLALTPHPSPEKATSKTYIQVSTLEKRSIERVRSRASRIGLLLLERADSL